MWHPVRRSRDLLGRSKISARRRCRYPYRAGGRAPDTPAAVIYITFHGKRPPNLGESAQSHAMRPFRADSAAGFYATST